MAKAQYLLKFPNTRLKSGAIIKTTLNTYLPMAHCNIKHITLAAKQIQSRGAIK